MTSTAVVSPNRFTTLAHPSGWSWSTLIVGLLVLIVADAGIATEYDAVILAIVLAAIFPRYLLGLTILIVSMQNAPGASGMSWYVGFSAMAVIAFFRQIRIVLGNPEHFFRLPPIVLLAMLVILYGTTTSTIFALAGGPAQDPSRPFLMVGGLMIVAIWLGNYFSVMIRLNKIKFREYVPIVWLTLGHSLFLVMGQIAIDPIFLNRPPDASDADVAAQLVTATALGIPRITGQFLSPNTMALYFILIFLILFGSRPKWTLSRNWFLFWIVGGLIVSLASLSKAITLMILVSILNAIARKLGWVLTVIFGLSLATIVVAVVNIQVFEILKESFRFSNELSGNSLRNRTWTAVLTEFTASNWIFGTGLSHWPSFLEKTIGIRLSDPHSFALSVPGTFGLAGVLFYLYMIGKLIRTSLRSRGGRRFVIAVLLSLFLIRDLFGIPYVFGNTPLTFLIWFVLLRSLYPCAREPEPAHSFLLSGPDGLGRARS